MRELKKRASLLLVIILAMAVNMEAGPITVEQARENALSFFSSETGMKRAKGMKALTLAYTLNIKDTNQPALYAFNIGDGNGFVIASGDDIAEPVLGYSDTGAIDPNNIPDNVKAWFDNYAKEISKAQANVKTSSAKAPAKARSTVNALVKAKWSQHAPYNDQCIFNNKRCLTGCVATAIAQIMHYWATVGKGGKTFKCGCTALPGYITPTEGYTVGALKAVTTFDWANMPENTPTTTTTNAAVAKLIRYCAQASEMDFREGSSAAYVAKAVEGMKYNFGYNFGIRHIFAKNYTNNEWDDIIYNEVANGRPVFVSGYSNGGGHAFVCDGYNSSLSKFHFNWGWAGYLDGWFAMTALTPASNHDFSEDKDAIINIQPLDNSAYAVLSTDASTLTFYNDLKRSSRQGTVYEIPFDGSYPKWLNSDKITSTKKVVFDASFASARPISTEYWFYEMNSLSSISGIAYLNTSETKNTHAMFQNCSALTTLDLSNFNTANVTNMSSMFYGCSGLKSLDVSKFNTSKVTNMASMFYSCTELTSIKFGNQNGGKVTNINYMFNKCSKLKSLDLSSFDFSAITSSNYFSQNCTSLSQLAIPASASKINYAYAFTGVGKATAPCVITAPAGFDFGATTSALYFKWKNGYFFLKGTVIPYAFVKDGKLSFYNDSNPWGHEATAYNTSNTGTKNPGWYSQHDLVTAVEIDASFAKARPKSTYTWFSDMVNLQTVSGMTNLNMSQTTNSNYMFKSCTSLKEITLPSTLTSIGSYMFYNCSSLKNIIVPEGVTTIGTYAFNNCNALESATLPSTLTTLGSYNFYKCDKLTSVTVNFTKPITLASSNFSNRRNAYLYVPGGCVAAFKAATYWKEFKWINENSNYKPGDVDHDGTVSLNDILITVSYILGENPSGFYKTNADLVNDGNISLADIIQIVDIILTQ